MLATAIIVFREILEAALIVGVVLAASRGAVGRGFWVGSGIAGGVVGAALVAAFAGQIADAVEGVGQELFNAAVLLLAVVMLGWHNVWMKRHGRELAQHMAEVGDAVRAGGRPIYVLAVVVGVAVLREGSETVLFLYGIAAASTGPMTDMLIGGLLGLACGVALGAGLYLGLLRIPTRHLFTVTSAMVLLMAAGMASQAAAFLVQADMLPSLGQQLWDTSAVLAQNSVPGRILHTLVGYDARPAGVQLVSFAVTLAVIGLLMRSVGSISGGSAGRHTARPAAAR
ncbi:FTR1 family iron permease [Limobrevibacterium gyesilva]|uniref:FTR1 family protein n=1 Tax=Limobrevibacterium gyesilva TaxID=2991712 RepID=A0AA41YPW3_9PROT|nr:FTR1 family protein [Limobrevibacterium gyesilva]MCW3474310.1 FTR1 family protein [Limobrevibacterium gyesilva]